MQWILFLSAFIFCFDLTVSINDSFVQINNDTFFLNNRLYQALGVCLYPAHAANYEYIRRVISEANSNGFTLVRIVDIFESEYGKTDESITTDRIWKRVDWIIKICGDYQMKVLLDFSTLRQFLYYAPTRRDSYDPNVQSIWNMLVDFVTARQNSFTGTVYCNDSTIMSYAIAGEPIPYGGNLNDWSNGFYTSRAANLIEESMFNISDRLRAKDPNHLISAGGLLHLADESHYQRVWSYKNIDYSSLHIYPNEPTDTIGEWQNLQKYKNFSNSIHKPLMLEEFGSKIQSIRNNYMNQSFEYCFQNNISVVILWNWGLGGGFDVFSYMTSLMDIIHQQATRWGFDGQFQEFHEINQINQQTIVNIDAINPMTGDPGYGGPIVISSVNVTIPLSFTELYKWYWMFMDIPTIINITASYLAVDVFLPITSPSGLFIKFHVNDMDQDDSALRNNWLIPGTWNTVYVLLNSTKLTRPDGSDLNNNVTTLTSFGVLIINGDTIYSGNIFMNNFRLGTLTTAN